jgi:MYXO-CTERM domain-containing protein
MRTWRTIKWAATAAACIVLSWGTGREASAATVTESFDTYGASSASLSGLGSASGAWSTGWIDNAAPTYYPNVPLTLNKTGYSNLDNGVGAAGYGTTGNAGSTARRGLTYPGLNGTVWVSALAQISTGGDALLWFGGSTAPSNFVGLRSGVAAFKYNGGTQLNGASVTLNTPHLLLAKVQVGGGSAADSIDIWLDPDLSTGEAGLPTASFSGSGSQIFGSDGSTALDMSGIKVSFNLTGSYIDAIRISNDADGFTQVTMVPEPAAMGLLGLFSLGLLRRRGGIQ